MSCKVLYYTTMRSGMVRWFANKREAIAARNAERRDGWPSEVRDRFGRLRD